MSANHNKLMQGQCLDNLEGNKLTNTIKFE